MSLGWSAFIIGLITLNIVGCAWLLWGNRNVKIDPNAKGNSTGHEYDGIEELNNPLPAWWTWLFVMTIIYALIYLVLYPGFGHFSGVLGWSSGGQYQAEVDDADARFGPIFAAYAAQPLDALLREERALAMGGRIFGNNCSTCHGSDARGGQGYPNLSDQEWLHGGTPDAIKHTITEGRNGNMPPLAMVIGGDAGVADVSEYVLSMSGREHDAAAAARGKMQFDMICSACHQADGTGNPMLGSPNLTDNVWLHGGRREDLARAMNQGILNQMPSHKKILTPEQIHLVAAYVYSLSKGTPESSP